MTLTMTKVFIIWILQWYFFVLLVILMAGRIYGESSRELSESSNFFLEGGSRTEFTNEITFDDEHVLSLDFSQTGGSYEENYSIESPLKGDESTLSSLYYNPFLYEFELNTKIVCHEQFCKKGLHSKRSSKLFKSYTKSVLKHYILESKVRSWFFRLWSESTVLTSPVLYIEKKQEFKDIYKIARNYYHKLKDSAVIIILKVLTKKVSKELALEEMEEEEVSKSISNTSENEEHSYSSENGEETRAYGKNSSAGVSYSISQAVKNLCVKLRGLSKHRTSDNGQSYLFVIEAHEITDRIIFSKLMTSLIQTSCWNRANVNKSRVIIPIIVGNFKYNPENQSILSDVYYTEMGSGNRKSKSNIKQTSKSKSRSESSVNLEDDDLIENFDQSNLNLSVDLKPEYNELFIKWLKRCNESKVIHQKYQLTSPGLFEKLLNQYLVYAINNNSITRELSKHNQGSRHFMSQYPKNCHHSWNDLLKFIETEYNSTDVKFKIILISTILESLHVANFTLFKEADIQSSTESDQKEEEIPSKEQKGKENDIEKETEGIHSTGNDSNHFNQGQIRSKIENHPEVSDLYSILSSKEQKPITLLQARIMDDLINRLQELPDQRKSRLEFKNYISSLKLDHQSLNQVLELFEAIDHVQNSFHLLRVMFITNIDLGLTLNPLEIIISVCRNAKMVPIDSQSVGERSNKSLRKKKSKKGRKDQKNHNIEDSPIEQSIYEVEEEYSEEEKSQNAQDELQSDHNNENNQDILEECDPFKYLSKDLLSEDYDGDVMESIQKSSIKFASLILGLSQYNTKILNIHISNLVIKTERLMLSNILENQKISTMVLILSEKIRTFPFNTLSSFSYLKEISETRTIALLKPFIPLFPSYTLIGLFGDSIEFKNPKQFGKILIMEICILYYDPKSFLDQEFVDLCISTWESNSKDEEYNKSISKANSKCKKLSKEVKGLEIGNKVGNSSPTVFLFCDLLDKLVNGPSSRNEQSFNEIKELYVSKEFNNKCENIKSYSIQQSGNLYNMLVKL
ncbi:putative signal peptide-containing protein [Cryptosporidium parvum]